MSPAATYFGTVPTVIGPFAAVSSSTQPAAGLKNALFQILKTSHGMMQRWSDYLDGMKAEALSLWDDSPSDGATSNTKDLQLVLLAIVLGSSCGGFGAVMTPSCRRLPPSSYARLAPRN